MNISFLVRMNLLVVILVLGLGIGSDARATSLAIYALRYGANSFYPGSRIFAVLSHKTKTRFAWIAYLVKKDDQLILIDTGFNNEAYRKRFGIGQLYDFSALLKSIGFSRQSITCVILTHAHVDHAGNIGLFPQAHFYIQKDEYAYIEKMPILADQLAHIPPTHITLFRNFCSPLPDITIKRVGGHTKGSCIIEIRGHKQRFLFPGDNCYLQKNCRDKDYVGDVVNRAENRRFINAYYDYPGIILTHHDPDILAHAKQIAGNVFLIYSE